MKRFCAFVLVLLHLTGCIALADSGWLIADSDTRLLTDEELWQWDYESLEYIKYEIYARHGFHFVSGTPYRERNWR